MSSSILQGRLWHACGTAGWTVAQSTESWCGMPGLFSVASLWGLTGRWHVMKLYSSVGTFYIMVKGLNFRLPEDFIYYIRYYDIL